MRSQWLDWAKELQALAQAGLHYTKDIYDKERFQRIREISWQMFAQLNKQSYDLNNSYFSLKHVPTA